MEIVVDDKKQDIAEQQLFHAVRNTEVVKVNETYSPKKISDVIFADGNGGQK